MNEKQFERLIDRDKNQVYLKFSRVGFPYGMLFIHTYMVTNKQGVIDRWEVYDLPNQCDTSWGHVHQNLLPPTHGMEWWSGFIKKRFKGKLIALLDEEEHPIVKDMIDFIEERSPDYPYRHLYDKEGMPNSNTYIQWILNHFPESGLTLPWNSYGKGYEGLNDHLPKEQSQT